MPRRSLSPRHAPAFLPRNNGPAVHVQRLGSVAQLLRNGRARRMLTEPPHLRSAHVGLHPIRHVWHGSSDYHRRSHVLEGKLEQLSDQAVLACAIGIAEWGVWRLSTRSDLVAPLLLIEAAWAANIDVRYCKLPEEKDVVTRRGPIDGALQAFNDLLERLLRSYETPRGSQLVSRAAYLYFLSRHVVPNKTMFDGWLKFILARCAERYPRAAASHERVSVEREAMDPGTDLQAAEARMRQDEFLRGLDPVTNPYLRTPRELRKLGFSGVPYRI